LSKAAQSEWLVSTDWVAKNLDNPDIRIIEVGSLKDQQAYTSGHIPGAVDWPWQKSLWHPTMREFVRPHDFAELMSKSGVRPDTTVIFYSNLIQFSTYAFWVCTMRGHKNLKIMNGNRDLWIQEGRPLTQDLPPITPALYPIGNIDESCRIGRQGVLAGLETSARVLVDMRTPDEYMGKRVSPNWFAVDHGAVRKGHIPGARHLYYAGLLNEDETFKSPTDLQDAFSGIDATPAKEIVFYCRLSHRGTMAWFITRFLLGYPRVKVYDGSWTEWGSIVGLPIVNRSLTMDNILTKTDSDI
jgi:thiosulfate/3-mercaptopyruvate sulfurtransferase